ncbi:MAG: hypothetical protein ACREEL_02230 [Stellaceae bacterium]
MLTVLAAAGALTVALAEALPLGGPALGGSAGLTLAGAGMAVCGLALCRQRHEAAAATRPAAPAIPMALAPVPRFFPKGGPNGRVVPFGRKGEMLSETKLAHDLVRRAERVCATSRARAEDEIR